ncbi:ankyrin repeat [Trichoderma arundinaceum]|uniref:Ankyrin repeat n=1 Tax=Trichoderma arundinaceum TaxID=490622 RepID=A0A395NIF1_TRIAR|nr:ankyrin repeat [Trichoderma arundinaceum]
MDSQTAVQAAVQTPTEVRTHDEYTVGWVCTLSKELTAAAAMLDRRHDDLPKPPNDPNTYTLGSLGKHNVVIACLPKGQIGNSPATSIVTWMVSTFPSIKIGLMVGIGGGVPPKVRLGDVVVSTPMGSFPGVIQWDIGKMEVSGFERTGALDNPPRSLLTALTKLETEHELTGSKIPEYLDELKQRWPRLAPKYTKSDPLKDLLFRADYNHVCQSPRDQDATSHSNDESEEEENCRFCDKTKIVKRKPRDMRIHYGLIASDNQVIESATIRDKLNKDLGGNILCVEMEAAGLMNNFPCVIIRGICDYADSHKNKDWQEHAAAVAAALAKELLEYVQPSDLHGERVAKAILNQESEDNLQVLTWITPVDYGPQHSDFLKRWQPGTGQWLLDSAEYQSWLISKKQTLFCPGIPGAGKTILTSIVINDLEERFEADPIIGIAYIYCNYQRQKEQEIENLFSSLIKQLSQSLPSLPDCVRDIYRKNKSKKTRPSLDEILAVLHSILEMYTRVFIIIDALDEYQSSPVCRQKLLAELFNLQQKCGANFLMTSRFIPEIVDHFKTTSVFLEIRASTKDVRRYLKGQIELLPTFIQQNQELQKKIIAEISEVVDGMFLLAQVYIHSLKDMITPKSVTNALKGFQKLAPGLSEANKVGILAHAYKQAMLRINEQQPGFKKLANHVLSWIVCAERQITTVELQHALAVEVGEPELDKENLPSIQDMVSACAGLVTVDDESRIIRLVHYTTQEYFNQTRNHWFPDAEANVTDICITYLLFSTFKNGPCQTDEEFKERSRLNPFYIYAADNWGHHARKASRPLLPHKIMEFLECEAIVDSSIQAQNVTEYGSIFPLGGSYRLTMVTGLHLAAYFGIEKAVATLLDKGVDIDLRDSHKQALLCLAAQNGHEAVVKILLVTAGVNPNYRGQSEGIDVNAMSRHHITPLWLAASKGFEDIVKLLLATPGVDPSSKGHGRSTPLLEASRRGFGDVVKLLLTTPGVDPDSKDDIGRTPLWVAVCYGHEAVVKLLLATPGVDPDSKDDMGRTPLWVAASKGFNDTVKLLLTTPGVDPNSEDHDGATPLFGAVFHRREDIVKLMLSTPSIDLNYKDSRGRIVLWHAAFLGYEDIVKLLLATPGINLDSADCDGETPLSAAVLNGHEAVVKILLAAGADPGSDYRLLQLAIRKRHEGVVKLLLAAGVNPGLKDPFGNTSLKWAIFEGHAGIVNLLLAAGFDPDSEDYDGETPLLRAVRTGYEAIVKLLLQKQTIPDSREIHRLLQAANAGMRPPNLQRADPGPHREARAPPANRRPPADPRNPAIVCLDSTWYMHIAGLSSLVSPRLQRVFVPTR